MRTILFGIVLCVLLFVSNGWMLQKTTRAVGKASRTTSSVVKSSHSGVSLSVPALIAPFLLPVAAFAAEGTGRAFGIDDSRLIWAAITPLLIIFPLYSKWSKDQEGDDFFDGYEKRRNG